MDTFSLFLNWGKVGFERMEVEVVFEVRLFKVEVKFNFL
jgi:hypothetical protein